MSEAKKLKRRQRSTTSSIRFVMIIASLSIMGISTFTQYIYELSLQEDAYKTKTSSIAESIRPMLEHALTVHDDNMLKAIGDQLLTHPEVIRVGIWDGKNTLRYEIIKPTEKDFSNATKFALTSKSTPHQEVGHIQISYTKGFLQEAMSFLLIRALIFNALGSISLIAILYWYLSKSVLSPLQGLAYYNRNRNHSKDPATPEDSESFLIALNDIEDEIHTIGKHFESQAEEIQEKNSLIKAQVEKQKASDLQFAMLFQKHEFIMKGNELGSWELDVETNETEFNQRWYEMLGLSYSNQTADLQTWHSRVHPEDIEILKLDLQNHADGNSDSMRNVHRIKHEKGHWLWVLCQGKAISRSPVQRAIRIIGSNMDISDLNNAKEEALAANKSKSEFLANMSHEIRTPLNGVLGMASLLKRTQLDATQLEFIKTIEISGKQLLSVISDILDLSKVEAGKFELSPIKSNIRMLIENVIRIISPAAEAKGLVVSSTISPAIPESVYCDDTRLQQVLVNLLNNAVKFTAKGSVFIHADARPSTKYADRIELEFHIVDEGIGIPQEQLQNLFKAFTQADATVTRKFGGTGLGLVISKQIIELMSGSISVTSQVNRGSDFNFTIHLPTYEIIEEEKAISAKVELSHLKVLIAEDSIINQKALYKMLRSRGITAAIAANGVEATHLATSNQYDLIFMDIVMPEMDGREAAKRIVAHAHSKNQKPPKIIAISANVKLETPRNIKEIGLFAFIEKPVTFAQIDRILANLNDDHVIQASEERSAS